VGVRGPSGDDVLHAFVQLEPDVTATDVLEADIKGRLRREAGPEAAPRVVRFVRALPKAKSGEVARAILRKIAQGDVKDLGDVSALADPSVIDDLVKARTPAEA
jgi:acetyl-CoA synthetase